VKKVPDLILRGGGYVIWVC